MYSFTVDRLLLSFACCCLLAGCDRSVENQPSAAQTPDIEEQSGFAATPGRATDSDLSRRSPLPTAAPFDPAAISDREESFRPSVSHEVAEESVAAAASPTKREEISSEIDVTSAELAEDVPETSIRLVDVTEQTGIDFQHTDGGGGEGYIVEGMASGIVVFDYDGDGLEDVYFLNGAPLRGTVIDTMPRNRLYRNKGDWAFTDVTDEAGVGDSGFALGGTAGDYDNDGDLDLYVTNFGPNVLYRNDGNGRFTDVTDDAGVSAGDMIGAGCSFFDMDADGDLDLYVANYVDFRYDNHVPIEIKGHRFQAGPQYYQSVPDSLFRNEGNGRFTDVSEASGIRAVSGPGMATLCWDFDVDGDQDVFVCNDGEPNFLFVNDGSGHFQESALLMGLAYDFSGKANSSMGVDAADYDHDGLLDLFVTDYQVEMPVLYHNLGNGLFEDVSLAAKIDGDLFAHVHWGTGFVDFDNDRDRDLFVACGHFDPIELIDDRTAKAVRNYLLLNQGDGTFADVSMRAGSGMQVVASSRGAAFDDFDNDGDIDAIVLNSNAAPTVLRNESVTGHHWLLIELRAGEQNRFAVGAKVRVVTGDRTQTGISVSGRGYQSHFGTRLHFGLGSYDSIKLLEVTWPGGMRETFDIGAVDRVVELHKGTGQRSGPARDRETTDGS